MGLPSSCNSSSGIFFTPAGLSASSSPSPASAMAAAHSSASASSSLPAAFSSASASASIPLFSCSFSSSFSFAMTDSSASSVLHLVDDFHRQIFIGNTHFAAEYRHPIGLQNKFLRQIDRNNIAGFYYRHFTQGNIAFHQRPVYRYAAVDNVFPQRLLPALVHIVHIAMYICIQHFADGFDPGLSKA